MQSQLITAMVSLYTLYMILVYGSFILIVRGGLDRGLSVRDM